MTSVLDTDGGFHHVQGSGSKPYVLKNTQGVLSCSCPAWRNQAKPIDLRTCKHLISVRGASAEAARTNAVVALPVINTKVEWAMLAESWSMGDKVVGWYYSEKLDGVRLKWDHVRKVFITRAGNIVTPPDWFVKDFPKVDLDGELWMGRGKFQEVSSLARSANGGDRWKDAFFMIFDMPIEKLPWEERLDRLSRLANDAGLEPMSGVQRLAKKGFVLPQQVITEETDLMGVMDNIMTKGGEGLMLKKPRSLYVPRRSPALLKMKRFLSSEAQVIEVLEGSGKNAGQMGALKVKNTVGTIFAVGSGFTDSQRRDWWNSRIGVKEAGVIIEYQYQELDKNSGVPRFPTFKRIRGDLKQLPSPF